MLLEITSGDEFVHAFRAWRARLPLSSKQVAKLLGISLLRVHLYETGCFKFMPERENAVLRQMRRSTAPVREETAVPAQELAPVH